jgi:hypothetical protein
MTKSLPIRPNLDHLKNEAKAILKSHKARETSVCSVLKHLKRFKNSSDAEILSATVTLLEAQQALAVEYGFKNWIQMRNHVNGDSNTINVGDMKHYEFS